MHNIAIGLLWYGLDFFTPRPPDTMLQCHERQLRFAGVPGLRDTATCTSQIACHQSAAAVALLALITSPEASMRCRSCNALVKACSSL